MSTWSDLKALRAAGHVPLQMLTVFGPGAFRNFRAAMVEIGGMVIDHDPGEPIPLDLIGGLDVLLLFERCADACDLGARLRGAEISPASCRVWCSCSEALTVTPGACKP